MARPKKDNAEYFPHDAAMRNDDRIKALRKKYKLAGYAIWNMLIEYIAGRDHFRFEHNDFTLEIMAGDFDADVKEIEDVISYCLTLGLLQQIDGFIRCKTLENRLEPVLLKRKLARDGVSVTESPQSKGKKSKVQKSKAVPALSLPEFYSDGKQAFEDVKANELLVEQLVRIARNSGYLTYTDIQVMKAVKKFFTIEAAKPEFPNRPRDDIKTHLVNWVNSNAKKIADYG